MSHPVPALARTFDPVPETVRRARRFVLEVLQGQGLTALCDTAALVVSELVTNAVLHARTAIEVRVSVSGDRVRVEVADGRQTLPETRSFSELAGSGRGLHLVNAIVAAWGADRESSGKVVWVELDATAQADEVTFDLDQVEPL